MPHGVNKSEGEEKLPQQCTIEKGKHFERGEGHFRKPINLCTFAFLWPILIYKFQYGRPILIGMTFNANTTEGRHLVNIFQTRISQTTVLCYDLTFLALEDHNFL